MRLVSFDTTKDPTTRRLSIPVPSDIAFFARRQECQSKIICSIVMRNVLESAPTIIKSRVDWEDL